MKQENIKKAYEKWEPIFNQCIANGVTIKMRNTSLPTWNLLLRNVPDTKVINLLKEEMAKGRTSMSVFEIVDKIYPEIEDDESAMAHGYQSFENYIDCMEAYGAKRLEHEKKIFSS